MVRVAKRRKTRLVGFEYIQNIGIRAVEFDVRQLKDNALVVMHDDQFIRTTGQAKHCTNVAWKI